MNYTSYLQSEHDRVTKTRFLRHFHINPLAHNQTILLFTILQVR